MTPVEHITAAEPDEDEEHSVEYAFARLEYVSGGRTRLALRRAPPPPLLHATCPGFRASARDAAQMERVRDFVDERASLPWREMFASHWAPPPHHCIEADAESAVEPVESPEVSPKTPGTYLHIRWGVPRPKPRRAERDGSRERCSSTPSIQGSYSHRQRYGVHSHHGTVADASRLIAAAAQARASVAACCSKSKESTQGLLSESLPEALPSWTMPRSVAGARWVHGGVDSFASLPMSLVPQPRPDWEILDRVRPSVLSCGERNDFCRMLEMLETFFIEVPAPTCRKLAAERSGSHSKHGRRPWSPPGQGPTPQVHRMQ